MLNADQSLGSDCERISCKSTPSSLKHSKTPQFCVTGCIFVQQSSLSLLCHPPTATTTTTGTLCSCCRHHRKPHLTKYIRTGHYESNYKSLLMRARRTKIVRDVGFKFMGDTQQQYNETVGVSWFAVNARDSLDFGCQCST